MMVATRAPDNTHSNDATNGSEQCGAKHCCGSHHSTHDAGCADEKQAAPQRIRCLSNGFPADKCDRRRLWQVGTLVGASIEIAQ